MCYWVYDQCYGIVYVHVNSVLSQHTYLYMTLCLCLWTGTCLFQGKMCTPHSHPYPHTFFLGMNPKSVTPCTEQISSTVNDSCVTVECVENAPL